MLYLYDETSRRSSSRKRLAIAIEILLFLLIFASNDLLIAQRSYAAPSDPSPTSTPMYPDEMRGLDEYGRIENRVLNSNDEPIDAPIMNPWDVWGANVTGSPFTASRDPLAYNGSMSQKITVNSSQTQDWSVALVYYQDLRPGRARMFPGETWELTYHMRTSNTLTGKIRPLTKVQFGFSDRGFNQTEEIIIEPRTDVTSPIPIYTEHRSTFVVPTQCGSVPCTWMRILISFDISQPTQCDVYYDGFSLTTKSRTFEPYRNTSTFAVYDTYGYNDPSPGTMLERVLGGRWGEYDRVENLALSRPDLPASERLDTFGLIPYMRNTVAKGLVNYHASYFEPLALPWVLANHSDWIMTDEHGGRCENNDWVELDIGNDAVIAAYVGNLEKYLNVVGVYKAYILDGFSTKWTEDLCANGNRSKYQSDAQWQAQVTKFLTALATMLHSYGSILIINGGHVYSTEEPGATWVHQIVDGTLQELGPVRVDESGNPVIAPYTAWVKTLKTMMDLPDKRFIFQTSILDSDPSLGETGTALYLLGRSAPWHYINWTNWETIKIPSFAGLDLQGAHGPLEELPGYPMRLDVPEAVTCVKRNYEEGMVLAAFQTTIPGAKCVFSLANSFQDLNDNIVPAGILEIPAGTGRILKGRNSEIDAPPTITSEPSVSANPVITTSTIFATSATDDYKPENLTFLWERLSGPGSIAFDSLKNGKSEGASIQGNFFSSGEYVVKVTVSDQFHTVSRSIAVTVLSVPTSARMTAKSRKARVGKKNKVTTTVLDQFGSRIQGVHLKYTVTPRGASVKKGHFIAKRPGRYRIKVAIGSLIKSQISIKALK